MALSTLTPTAADFGAEQSFMTTLIDQYNNRKGAGDAIDSITGMYLTEARAMLTLDLQEMLGLDPADATGSADLDALVDAHPARMKRALAKLQTVLFWGDNMGEEGSVAAQRLRKAESEYAAMKSAFTGLRGASGSDRVQTVRVVI